MSLTDHFRQIDATKFPDEGFLAELGKAVRVRLQRMEMWDQPPAYLGYHEFGSWNEAFADGEAYAAPTLDCYEDMIRRRYSSLKAHLLLKDNIDGLIRLNIERFFLKRQRSHDPIGYSVFKNLEAVLEIACREGRLQAEQRVGSKLRNRSLLRFRPDAVLADPVQIESAFGSIADWQIAVTRQSKIGKGAQRLLDQCVRAMPSVGISAFLLADLVEVLKKRVKQAHAERMLATLGADLPAAETEENIRGIIRILQPTARYHDPEALDALLQKIRAAIETMEGQERTCVGVRRLFEELCSFADTDEGVPPWAELARRLGVRRTTLWDHVERLRNLVESLDSAS